MKTLKITQEDITDMNIRLARDLIVGANTTPFREEKLKSLLMANQIIERTLLNEGIDFQEIKIKKEKK